jgi:hypothetical protein
MNLIANVQIKIFLEKSICVKTKIQKNLHVKINVIVKEQDCAIIHDAVTVKIQHQWIVCVRINKIIHLMYLHQDKIQIIVHMIVNAKD